MTVTTTMTATSSTTATSTTGAITTTTSPAPTSNTTTIPATTTPSPTKPTRGAIVAVYPSGTCNLAGLNSQVFLIHAPETNASCLPLADTPFFYKLALDARQESIVYAKLDCKDSTCSTCGVDVPKSPMSKCLSSATHSDRSFVIRAESQGVCLGGASTPSSDDMIEILYQGAGDNDGCNANSSNVTITNIGPVTNNCQPQSNPNFYRQLTYINDEYEYASDCTENLAPLCLGCERQPRAFTLGDCLAPDSAGRVVVQRASTLTNCVNRSSKGSKSRAGTVAAIVIGALFLVIILFFLYVRQQRKSGAAYEAIQ